MSNITLRLLNVHINFVRSQGIVDEVVNVEERVIDVVGNGVTRRVVHSTRIT